MANDPTLAEYRNALFEALAGATTGVSDAEPAALLRRLAAGARTVTPAHPLALPLFNHLYEIGATNSLEDTLAAARNRFSEVADFREAIYLARCVSRDTHSAFDMSAAHDYLTTAHLPADGSHADLVTDREAVLDTLSFETLWREPARLGGLLNLVQIWKQEYFRHYAAAHAGYQATLTSAVDQLEATRKAASALAHLNSLRRLGPPVATAILAQHRSFERLFPCAIRTSVLATMLAEAPFCRECSYRLGETPPAAEMRRVGTAIERGLAVQQERLARVVVSRILAAPATDPDDRLQRFIQVVQASDLQGLAVVLDDDLLGFLDNFLAESPLDGGILEMLAEAYPEVRPDNAEQAVDAFRHLLAEALSREGIARLRTNAGRFDEPLPEEP